ncbi:MAG: Zn-ribbon domain-containing OB-fold protein [Myxococcota bacterium]
MKREPLLPPIGPESEPFFEGTRRGELRIQRCSESGRLIFPPRPMSPFAPHATPTWMTVSGNGTIWSFAVPHPPLLPYYADRAPYNVIVVALDEDPRIRLVGNLVASEDGDIGEVDPETISIGDAVRVVFQRIGSGIHLPRWMVR